MICNGSYKYLRGMTTGYGVRGECRKHITSE